jgi:outer membrane protein assembly factor BamB
LRTDPARLACLRLGAFEGRLEWSVDPAELNPGAGWRFAGPPVVIEDDLAVAVERANPQPELGVVRLRGVDGSVVWLQSVCGLLAAPGEERAVYGRRPLLESAGQLFLATEHGAVACLDAALGGVRWISCYPRRPQPVVRTAPRSRQAVSSLASTSGVVLLASSEAAQLTAWDAETGHCLWSTELPDDELQLAGTQGGRVYVTGRQLWALELETGAPLWRIGFSDPAGWCADNALLNGGRILWTTREELLVADAATGELLARDSLRDRWGARGGWLTAVPGGLLLADDEQLRSLPADAW